MHNFFFIFNPIPAGEGSICKFFADSKSRAQELSNDVSFVLFGHQTWDLKGGGQIDPPPAYPGFQVPQQG